MNKNLKQAIELSAKALAEEMAPQKRPDDPLSDPARQAAATERQVRKATEDLHQAAHAGYAVLMTELHKRPAQLGLDAAMLEAFSVSSDRIDDALAQYVAPPAESQGTEGLGLTEYSNEMLLKLYVVVNEFFQQQHFDEADQALQFLIVARPSTEVFRLMLGELYDMRGQVEEARTLYIQSIMANPFNFSAYKLAVPFLRGHGQDAVADQLLQEGMAIATEENEQDLAASLSALREAGT